MIRSSGLLLSRLSSVRGGALAKRSLAPRTALRSLASLAGGSSLSSASLRQPSVLGSQTRLPETATSSWRFFSTAAPGALHPLDPLTAAEITACATTIRETVGIAKEDDPLLEKLRFVVISLLEPTKRAAASTPRMAQAVILQPDTGLATEYVLEVGDNDTATIVSTTPLDAGVQPMFIAEDFDLAESIVQNDEGVKAALLDRYGISDTSTVACDTWAIHLAGPEEQAMVQASTDNEKPKRLVQTWLYHRQAGTALEDNHYAHPIDLLPVVDLNTRQVVSIGGMDRLPPPKIPTAHVNYHRDLVKQNTYMAQEWRQERLAALNLVQPDGPSFDVTGNEVNWQKWSFRVGFDYREGLILHDLAYEGRSVAKRASLVEMAVPYGDPHGPHARKCAFDVGDYGLGYTANSLSLGCDCLGHIHYFDAVLPNAFGEPVQRKSVVCMHEEDGGLLYKHVEYRNGHNESRRSRELVISSICTVVNYEYLFYWRLKQDGTIDFEIKLTGELSTNLLSAAEEASGKPTHGVLVAPGVNAQVHQHMFCARLDMNVDGEENTVTEIDVVGQPLDPAMNPLGNAFGPVETVLESEKQAIRTADPTKARAWKISNASGQTNPITGKPTAYKLLPFTKGPAQPTLLVDPTSSVATKGQFAQANLWVTAYDPKERYPAGEYTPQGDGKEGLPEWVAADRPLVGKDVVLWHAFGVTHVPRVEDFPVMPCESTGFTLKPDGFFLGNPGIDLEPEVNKASKCSSSK